MFVCNMPLLARRTRPSAARDDRVSCSAMCMCDQQVLAVINSHYYILLLRLSSLVHVLIYRVSGSADGDFAVIWYKFVYNIPYRRAPRLAFRPSASREQRYLAYKV